MPAQQDKLKELALETAKKKAEIERTVYYEDFVEAFKGLIKFVDTQKKELEAQAEKQGGELDTKLAEAIKTLEGLKKEATDKHNELQTKLESDHRTFQRMIEEKLSFFEKSLPDDYDDTELKEQLESLQTAFNELEIPEKFDATELQSKVESHDKKIEELEKRPTGTGGGVTNARIQQAFKYILKTEEPVGDLDGANLTYTLSQPIFAILSMSLNGEYIAQLPNYTISGKTFTFTTALPSSYAGKDWEVKYI